MSGAGEMQPIRSIERAVDDEAAFAWYRSAPLPSFGDLTAEDLVKQGRAEAVKRHISRVAAGGHA